MNVCIVGNGPTAAGKGSAIDAADFVVRIKAWWVHAAKNAGNRCDAIAWYGDLMGWDTMPNHLQCEHWLTHAFGQYPNKERLQNFSAHAGLNLIRWIPVEVSKEARQSLGSYPTTGFLAVVMAMAIFAPSELWLYGFDACGPDRPNFHDARRRVPGTEGHDQLREKRAFAELFTGKWLGRQVATVLKWDAMPNIEGDTM